MHGGEELAIALQRRGHVKNPGRAEDLLHEFDWICLQQILIIGALRQRLVFRFSGLVLSSVFRWLSPMLMS